MNEGSLDRPDDSMTVTIAGHRVGRVAFGCCPMGEHGWGSVDRNELYRAVHRALDLGINLFDTADTYGLGRSESTLGEALRQLPASRRREAFVATKFGVRAAAGQPTTHDTRPSYVHEALSSSLRRLGLECVDLYQVHYWDRTTPLPDTVEALEREREAGRIRTYGVTNIDPAEHGLECRPGFVSVSEHYNILDQGAGPMLRRAVRQGFVPLTWGSLGQGILSGRFRKGRTLDSGDRRNRPEYGNFHGERFARIMAFNQALESWISGRHDATLAQAAVRYILDKLPGSAALVGIKGVAQLEELAGALRFTFSGEDLRGLEELRDHHLEGVTTSDMDRQPS